MNKIIPIENHPLEPFCPPQSKLLMLGSFPPQQKRWCMDFYYPNYNNDMWRILGIIFYHDKLHFVDELHRTFYKEDIIRFLTEHQIAIFDTATQIRRLQDNASDKFLEVVTPTDITKLIAQMPNLEAIVTTGQKATETLSNTFGSTPPKVGEYTCLISRTHGTIKHYRMPSSSRAYPLSLEKKALKYKTMFDDLHLIKQ